ncbi:MAG: tetratricopeptide repeat protein [Candidatus Kerfeldbacteria bacterium]|nr:tetratricopeptide repeat protein [Candidatus Kerfeldbacteria bacterium]
MASIPKNKTFIITLLLAGFLIYGYSLGNSFIWDDEEQIVNNALVHSLSNLPSFFSGSTFNSGGNQSLGGIYYKPLMTSAYALLYTIFGPQPFWFHLLQLLLHLASAIIIFWLFRRLLTDDDKPPDRASWLLPFGLALVFLLHPLNAETVVYIADLQDVLFLFFGLLAVLFVTRPKQRYEAKTFWLALWLLMTLLSKETGVIFLPLILAYYLLFNKSRLKSGLMAMAGAAVVYGLLRFAVAGIYLQPPGLSLISQLPLGQRLLNMPLIIIFYLKNFFWPNNLSIDQNWAITAPGWSTFWLPLLVIVLILALIISGGLYLKRRHNPYRRQYAFFSLWLALGLGLHLQIFPLDASVTVRWFYLPMVGALGLIGVGLRQLHFSNKKLQTAGLVMACLIILSLAVKTASRTLDWRDGLTLYRHDIKYARDSFHLENNFGVELFRHGRYQEAKQHFVKSTELAPQWWTNWNNLGAVYEREKNYNQAKESYQKSVANSDYYLAYENLANLLLWHFDTKEAQTLTGQSLLKFPYNAKLWQTKALIEYKLDNKDEALKAIQNSLTILPNQENYYIYSRLSQNLPLELP